MSACSSSWQCYRHMCPPVELLSVCSTSEPGGWYCCSLHILVLLGAQLSKSNMLLKKSPTADTWTCLWFLYCRAFGGPNAAPLPGCKLARPLPDTVPGDLESIVLNAGSRTLRSVWSGPAVRVAALQDEQQQQRNHKDMFGGVNSSCKRVQAVYLNKQFKHRKRTKPAIWHSELYFRA